MSKFSSKTINVDRGAAAISDKFSDLTQIQSMIDTLPEAERAKIGDVKFNRDSIEVKTAQVGDIKFQVKERTPNVVKFEAVGAPVPVALNVQLDEKAPEKTDLSVVFDVQIPMMLRPLVAPHMQKAVDMLADVIGNVASK